MFESTEMQLIQFEAEQKNLNDNVSSEEKKNKQTKKKTKKSSSFPNLIAIPANNVMWVDFFFLNVI